MPQSLPHSCSLRKSSTLRPIFNQHLLRYSTKKMAQSEDKVQATQQQQVESSSEEDFDTVEVLDSSAEHKPKIKKVGSSKAKKSQRAKRSDLLLPQTLLGVASQKTPNGCIRLKGAPQCSLAITPTAFSHVTIETMREAAQHGRRITFDPIRKIYGYLQESVVFVKLGPKNVTQMVSMSATNYEGLRQATADHIESSMLDSTVF